MDDDVEEVTLRHYANANGTVTLELAVDGVVVEHETVEEPLEMAQVHGQMIGKALGRLAGVFDDG